MSDPAKDFFKRDLTDQEKDELTELLSKSEESAALFAKLAEKAYKDTGLPKPVWPCKPLSPSGEGHPASPFLKPLLASALVLALAVIALYTWKWKTQPPLSGISPVQERSIEPQPVSRDRKPAPQPRIEKAAPPPSQPEAAQPAPRKVHLISVSVERPQPGVAAVRVLDGQDVEVRALFTGILPEGESTFTWDGKTQDGALASPGTYFVEVKSGKDVLRREVKLEPDLSP